MRRHGPASVPSRASPSLALATSLLFLAIGCASTGTPPAAEPGQPANRAAGKATVYFYSMPGWVSPDSPVWILEGLRLVAAVESDAYSVAYLGPGEHWLRSWNTTAPPARYKRDCFDFQPDHVYYVLLERDGAMTLSSSDVNLRNLLEANPDLPLRELTPEVAAAAVKTMAALTPGPPPPSAEATEGAAPAAAEPATGIVIPSGIQIPLRLIENVNSYNTRAGEPILFQVEEEISVGDIVVVPAGLMVEGIVQNVARPRMAGIPGVVEVGVSRLVLPSGEVVPLQGFVSSAGRPSGAASTLGAMAAGGAQEGVYNADPYALGFALLMVLAMAAVRGHDAWMGAGTQAFAVVLGDTRVVPGSLAPEEPPHPASETELAAVSLGTIVVPDSCRVTSAWRVRLETPAPPSRVRIVSVGDLSPPRTVEATRIVSHGKWQEVSFPAWPVARFAVLGPSGPAIVRVALEGTLADGSPFQTTVTTTVQAQSQR